MWSYAKAESRDAESRNGVKRRAFKLLLFLLAGAIINVAVAWSIATRQPPLQTTYHTGQIYFDEKPRWSTRLTRGQGWLTIDAKVWGGFGSSYGSTKSVPEWSATFTHPTKEQVVLSGHATPLEHIVEVANGWPLLSLYSRTSSSEVVDDVAGIEAGFIRHNLIWPVQPIWPGFAINTIFYAAIMWMLFALPGVPRAVRRRVRIKRGQCASCGYSLRESVSEKCPECGATLKQKAETQKAEMR
jgi:predicted RNA-binding Zn-ribbon protein involved in translation (DUF1610 family)